MYRARRRRTVVHMLDFVGRACTSIGSDDPSVNALQELIQGWLDADPEHSVGVLAHRGKIPRNTVYALLGRDEPKSLPRTDTLEGLSKGMGIPLRQVREAAIDAVGGYHVEELDPDSQEIQAWVALLDELPQERRDELWAIGRLYLNRSREAP